MTETIVLGLDGANWPLLQPWLEAGELPNIASLREDGVWTDMESCLPPVTCPNWRCYSTGKNPGKLGVFWWENIDTDARTLSTPTARSFRSANYWDYLNDEGLSAGVLNLPMTYPPFEIDAFMVAGGPDSEQDDYAHPAALGDHLDEEGYRLHPDPPVTANDDTGAAAGVVDLIDGRLATFRRLVDERDPTVAHCTVFYVNVLQHFFWRGEPTRDAWQVIDDHVARLREEHPDATLMLMSDHGCTAVDTVFYANSWLEKEGYLTTTGGSAGTLASLGLNKEQLSRVAHRLGVHDLVRRLTPATVKDRLPDSEEGFRRERKLELVDWEQTEAIASGQGLTTVVDDDPNVIDRLVADLRTLEDDEGRPIASEVMRREEAYEGPYTGDAPAVIFDQREGVHTSGAIGDNPVFTGTGQWEAENVRTGLFLADGPTVAATGLPDTISITDIAPTVLHSVGCAVPEDVDGEVLELFGDVDVSYRDPIPFGETGAAAGEDVAERLENLGYLE
jgi:predicted AlkP superfamily phosphohydrolase/phosphomutase